MRTRYDNVSSGCFVLFNAHFGYIYKVVELNPSSHVGYQLKHMALLGAQRYDDAIAAFETMLLKLNSASDAQVRSKS
jgi:hypothetical protein